MSTTVRIDDDVKAELDRLQEVVQMETGQRVSHSELLARLLRFARQRPDVLFREEAAWVPLTPKQLAKLLEGVRDGGVETDVSKLDDELYGVRER